MAIWEQKHILTKYQNAEISYHTKIWIMMAKYREPKNANGNVGMVIN